MRLVAFSRRGDDDGGESLRRGGVGVLTDDGIYDLTRAALYWNADPDRPILPHLVRDVSLLILAGPEKLQGVLDLLSGGGSDELDTSFPLLPIDSVVLRAPLRRPPKIVGVGLNYLDHCREQGAFPPERPLLFAKFANAVTDPGAPIAHPEWTQQLDFECELGVVIGSTARRVSVDDAMNHVFGYTIVNDVTARDAQKSDRQWLRAKGADGFAPLGPVIVTADEVPDPQKLGIGSTVNGELRQYSSTSEMVFSVAQLISYISHSITLEPGDVIATGTPAGVGHYLKPPRYLEPGDVIRCEIEGIGVLENEIVEAPVAVVAEPEAVAAPDDGDAVAASAAPAAAWVGGSDDGDAPAGEADAVATDVMDAFIADAVAVDEAQPAELEPAELEAVGLDPADPDTADLEAMAEGTTLEPMGEADAVAVDAYADQTVAATDGASFPNDEVLITLGAEPATDMDTGLNGASDGVSDGEAPSGALNGNPDVDGATARDEETERTSVTS